LSSNTPASCIVQPQVQQLETAALVSAVGPLMLPYFKEKKLRVPRPAAAELHPTSTWISNCRSMLAQVQQLAGSLTGICRGPADVFAPFNDLSSFHPPSMLEFAQVQQLETASLVSAVGPLMLPYFKEKKLPLHRPAAVLLHPTST
jgi:hypothetical protein